MESVIPWPLDWLDCIAQSLRPVGEMLFSWIYNDLHPNWWLFHYDGCQRQTNMNTLRVESLPRSWDYSWVSFCNQNRKIDRWYGVQNQFSKEILFRCVFAWRYCPWCHPTMAPYLTHVVYRHFWSNQFFRFSNSKVAHYVTKDTKGFTSRRSLLPFLTISWEISSYGTLIVVKSFELNVD